MNNKIIKCTLPILMLLRTTDGITTGNTQYLHVKKNKRPVLIPRISHVGPDYNTWNCDHFTSADRINFMATYCTNFPSPGY
uniref:Secreted protein n=1 Tax=Arundo donax TaxID=35708 RepID=A0A0A9GBY0_ARUDO